MFVLFCLLVFVCFLFVCLGLLGGFGGLFWVWFFFRFAWESNAMFVGKMYNKYNNTHDRAGTEIRYPVPPVDDLATAPFVADISAFSFCSKHLPEKGQQHAGITSLFLITNSKHVAL